ncbi:hypothetical protein D3C72_1777510 [compost metagenome]
MADQVARAWRRAHQVAGAQGLRGRAARRFIDAGLPRGAGVVDVGLGKDELVGAEPGLARDPADERGGPGRVDHRDALQGHFEGALVRRVQPLAGADAQALQARGARLVQRVGQPRAVGRVRGAEANERGQPLVRRIDRAPVAQHALPCGQRVDRIARVFCF